MSSNFDIEEAKRLYNEEELSMEDIGQLYGISKQGVHYHFKKHNVPRRPRKWQPDDDQLRRMHLDQKMDATEMADALGVGANVVRRRLKELDIYINGHTKREWEPCADCGDPDGLIDSSGGVTPIRVDGSKYGFDGKLCNTCRHRHYMAARRQEQQ